MTPRQQRMLLVGLMMLGVGVAVLLALRAFEANLLYFYSPSQVLAGDAPSARRFRVGGLVVAGSVAREPGSLTVRFRLTDTRSEVPVEFTGILPDLFREGQGLVTHGAWRDGLFVADEVLAKHDENYMPPDVADALQRAHAEGVARAKARGAGG